MPRHWDVVILGGGFAGLACAKELERLWGAKASERVLLVSQENYFVFQPLLPEVVGASLEPWHVINPIRLLVRRCQVERAEVAAVDVARRRVEFVCTGGRQIEPVEAEHLVLSLGCGTDMQAVPGMMENALFMKNLADALGLRGHIIRRLEEAVVEQDAARRRALVHFAVVGGGYSGVETAAQIHDLLHAARRFYPTLPAGESRVTLIHSRDRLLPELEERLGRFAQRLLERRGMTIVLGARVKSVSAEAVRLDDDRRIETRNVICTIGNAPHPVLRKLPLEQDRGRVQTDEFLRAKGQTHVWAIGDCASNPDGFGGTCPPTAQFAGRVGQRTARNIAAVIDGRPPRPFQYRAAGQIASLGHRNGVCSMFGVRLSGFLAWWITRTIHLMKLPGLERKLRVVMDWTLDLFFPRDLNYLDLEKTQGVDQIYVDAGDVLFRQGDRSETFYVIEDGVIELTRRDSLGRVVFSEQLPAGSHFGEGSLIRDRVRTTTAVAKTPARLLVVGPKDFGSLVASCAVLRQALHETSFRFRPDEELANAPWPEELLTATVSQIMATPVETLPISATLADAFRAVAAHRRGNLPLVDGGGRLVAMITRTDLYRVVAEGRNLTGPIADVASRQITTLRPDQSVRDAISVLRRKRLKHAPVVDAEGKPAGMLSYLDVALACVQMVS
jgi:NADH dehydrogenase